MNTRHKEAAIAPGAEIPSWKITFIENITRVERCVELHAEDYQTAINRATERLNNDASKPEGTYYFKRCIRTSGTPSNREAETLSS